MNPEDHGLEQIKERLFKLEMQNRRLKQGGGTALIFAASILLMGQASRMKPVQASQTNTLEASQFILKDKTGKVRATFSIDERFGDSGPAQLVFYDGEGRQKVKLDSGALPFMGGALHLADEKGKDRVYISSSDGLGGTLSLLDSKGFPGTVLNTDNSVLPDVEAKSVSLKDTDGNIRARLFMTEKHTGDITLPGMSTPIQATLYPFPTLALYDLKGNASAYLNGEGDIKGRTVSTSDSQGHTLGLLSAVEGLGAMLSLDNGKGEQRLLLAPGHLELSDDDGFQSILGVEKNLVTVRTGETHQTSAASLLMFDKNKNVIWKAP